MNKTFKYLQALVLGGLLPLSVWSAPVKDRILDDVSISERDGCPEINIGLTLPIRYIRHFPYSHGRELRVEIRPLRVSEVDQDALRERESVSPPLRDTVSLQEVVYEGDIVGGPFVTLFFRRDMQYRVEQGRDYRSLKILINPADRIDEKSCFNPSEGWG